MYTTRVWPFPSHHLLLIMQALQFLLLENWWLHSVWSQVYLLTSAYHTRKATNRGESQGSGGVPPGSAYNSEPTFFGNHNIAILQTKHQARSAQLHTQTHITHVYICYSDSITITVHPRLLAVDAHMHANEDKVTPPIPPLPPSSVVFPSNKSKPNHRTMLEFMSLEHAICCSLKLTLTGLGRCVWFDVHDREQQAAGADRGQRTQRPQNLMPRAANVFLCLSQAWVMRLLSANITGSWQSPPRSLTEFPHLMRAARR